MRLRSRIIISVSALFLLGIASAVLLRERVFSPFFEQNNYSVDALLKNPVFDQTVKVSGKVESFGAMECPCFELAGSGHHLQVWYDLMLDGAGNRQPRADTSALKNGMTVTLTGVLRREQGAAGTPGLWLSAIEYPENSLAPTTRQTPQTCQQQCVTMGFATGKCQTPSAARPQLIRIGECAEQDFLSCLPGDSECGCMCAPVSDEPVFAAPPAAVFLLEQVRARSEIDFARAQAIEMRYPLFAGGDTPQRWLPAAATTASAGDDDLVARIDQVFTELGAKQEVLKNTDPAAKNMTVWRRDQAICLLITPDSADPHAPIELQCAVLAPSAG